MSSRSSANVESKVYIGGLTEDADEKELERAFSYYGRLRNVWVARRPPGFAFIEFEDHRDAADAVKALDGTTVCGVRVRVEHSSGRSRPKQWQRGPPPPSRNPPPQRGGRNDSDRCYECGEPGHLAYECRRRRGGGGGSGAAAAARGGSRRSRSRSPRSRSRSRSRSRRSYSRSQSRSRSRSYGRSNGRK